MKNRKLLRVGLPIRLSKLRTLLDNIDPADADNTIVLYSRSELVIEEPVPTLDAAEGDD